MGLFQEIEMKTTAPVLGSQVNTSGVQALYASTRTRDISQDRPRFEIGDAAESVKALCDAILARGLVVTVFGVPITIQVGK